jgi:hypothetical protein
MGTVLQLRETARRPQRANPLRSSQRQATVTQQVSRGSVQVTPVGAYKVTPKEDATTVSKVIRQNLKGMSLFVELESLTPEGRANAIDHLRLALQKLEN